MASSESTAEESLSDSHALLPAAITGDPAALGGLSQRLRPFLKEVVRRELASVQVGPESDYSDVVQQTLMRAITGISEFRGRTLEEWRGWLAAIARNEAKAVQRNSRAGRRDRRRNVPLNSEILPAATTESPSTALHQEELRQRLSMTIEQLSEDQQQLIRWRQEDQLSHAEIAERLGIKIDTARQRCKAAMDALRRTWREP